MNNQKTICSNPKHIQRNNQNAIWGDTTVRKAKVKS